MTSNSPLERILHRLKGVQGQNGHYKALCSAHDDHNPSLDVREVGEGDQRKVLIKCWAGCKTEAVLKELNLEWKDLYPENGSKKELGRIVATYDYTDADGNLLHQTIRYEPKRFLQRHPDPDGNGGFIWNLKGIETVLYHLPDVLEALQKGEPVYVLEGEKDVDRAREELDITATTCAMGAKKWRPSYTHTLAGANVILVPDNDEAGREHVAKVAEELQGTAQSVRILELPGVPEKGDLSDWLDAGGTREEFDLLSSSQPYIPNGDGDDISKGTPNEDADGAFGVVRFADLGEPKPREFIVQDVIVKGYPCLIHGGGGSAKSILSALAGVGISAGLENFLGQEILCRGPVLIIDFELEVDEQHRRVKALCEGLGIGIPDDLYYLSSLGMNTETVFKHAVKFCQKVDAVFCVIDSIGFAMRGDMESAKDVNAFYSSYVDPLRAIGVTPMIIDHQGKMQSGDKYQRKTAFGSAFKEHRARSILQVEATDNDRASGILKVSVRHKKANFSARFEPFGVELKFGIRRIDVKTVELTDAERASEETLTANERIKLALRDGDKTTTELAEYTRLSEGYLQNLLPSLRREGTVRVVKTEGRANTYGLPEPPDDGGDEPLSGDGKESPKKDEKSDESSDRKVEPLSDPSTADSPGNLSSPSPHPYRDGDGDDIEEGGAEPPPADSLSHHPLITSDEDLEALAGQIASADEVAIDLETCPPEKALDPRNGSVRLISLATKGLNKAVDVSKVHPSPLLDVLKEKTLVFYNGKFDLSFLMNAFDYEHEGEVKDVMLMHLVYYFAQGERVEKKGRKCLEDPDETRGLSNLAHVAKLYLGDTLDKSEQGSDWSVPVLSEAQIGYALKDTQILLPIKEELEERLSELGILEVADIENRALLGVTWAENNGMSFDKGAWLELAEDNANEAERFKKEIDHHAPQHPQGKEWNWNSGPQTLEALRLLSFDTSKLPKTDSGNPSTSTSALKNIKSPKRAKDFAQAILRYKGVQKLSSTYGEKWTKKDRANDHERVVNGRAYTSFRQMVSTGRMASRKPNLQNLPKDNRFRKAFKAPAGRRLIVADYAQIELMFGAIVAGDESMLSALKNREDLHLKTAKALVGDKNIPEAELKETYRKRAKAVNFGFLYGMGPKRFVEHAKNKFGLEISLEEAKRYREAFFETYPGLAQWHERVARACNLGEDVAFTLLGRPRKLSLQKSTRTGRYEPTFTEATNHPVQGSAADALKLTKDRLWRTRNKCPGNPLLVGTVHDELLLEVDADCCEEATDWLMGCMSEAVKEVTADPETPVVVEVETRESWGERA